MTTSTPVTWGDWMGSWKEALDEETERIDRQKAALGAESVARMKDLNVLILGMGGVGVETAKNLILSNVGSGTIWDPTTVQAADLGANFYLRAEHVAKTSRAQGCLADLKSLNPFCKVQALEDVSVIDDASILLDINVAGTGKPYAAVVVTSLSILSDSSDAGKTSLSLIQVNEICRSNSIAFGLAANHGVTTTLFSDFGPHHEITDEFGEPTQLLALSNLEVLQAADDGEESNWVSLLKIQGLDTSNSVNYKNKTVLLLTVAQSDHGLDDGSKIVLDDLRGPLSAWNGHSVTVQRVAFVSPTAAKIQTQDVAFQEILKQPTKTVLKNFAKQYDYYHKEFQQEVATGQEGNKKKFSTRTITMFNRLAVILENDKIQDILPNGLTLDDFKLYQSGGLLQQVRPAIPKSYKSLKDTLLGAEAPAVPQLLRGDHWEAGHGIEWHLCVAGVLEFHKSTKSWPRLHQHEDAKALIDICQDMAKARTESKEGCWPQQVMYGFPTGEPRDLDESKIRQFAMLFQTELTGLCAFLGGAMAQEVLKKTGKFTPINQWIHHNEPSLIAAHSMDPDQVDLSNVQPLFGSRYDHQIAIMGKDAQAKLTNQKVFLVGCGALGCEYLKGLALMGVATGPHGQIVVTDMDRIEVSNLSRQFLFRDKDVGSPKSVSGARVVSEWNPQLHIEALEKRVGTDSEDFFDDAFWESLDVCWNALDNVLARKYTDRQCLLHSKPLLESGTLGTKCNHEVILPYRTSTYNDGKESDENENQIAMCTLRSFPYLALHCIEFAKQAYFSDYFEFGPDQYESFRKDMTGFFEQLDSMEAGEQTKALTMIDSYIQLQQKPGGAVDFNVCIQMAFDRLIEDFRTSVMNLVHSADIMEANSGTKFWTGTKRRPRPIEWKDDVSKNAPELMEYLYCTANMYAFVWGLDVVRDRAVFESNVAALNLQQPEWQPPSQDVNLNEDDENDGGSGVDLAAEAERLKGELYKVDPSTLKQAFPHDFEKDDDVNFHIDFLTVATNLRAWNYDIKSSQRHTVKVTAGRIIPALATTTAMVCGLVDIEFCKLVLGLESQGRELFLNSNINLAAGSGNFTTFSPDPPIAISTGLKAAGRPKSFTSWDKISLEYSTANELSIEALVSHIETSFGVQVDRIFAHDNPGDKAIYSAVDKKKLNWDISVDAEGKPHVSDGVFSQWPQIRMAVQMLGRLPPTSGQRKIFEGQINNVKRALKSNKESFQAIFTGPVSAGFRHVYRPEDEDSEKQAYFDKVYKKREYVLLDVHCHTDDDTDVHLPYIKYVVSSGNSTQAMKRMKVEEERS